jgi:hypothetical protein
MSVKVRESPWLLGICELTSVAVPVYSDPATGMPAPERAQESHYAFTLNTHVAVRSSRVGACGWQHQEEGSLNTGVAQRRRRRSTC